MAVTNKKLTDENAVQSNDTAPETEATAASTPAAQRPAGVQVDTGNTTLRGVSDATAQQVAKYGLGYQQGDAVTQAQQALQQTLDNRPGDYQSKYGAQLDSVLQQITNPGKFQYNFNDDELFRYYADLYTQKGRQASQDAMGQAASLTGGYGNSYAQAAANQGYQQYLLGLYDKGMDLSNAAYQRYADERADQYNRLAALQNADQTAYGRYRDTYGDWLTDRDYYTNAESQAYARDYGAWSADRDYWNQQQQLENSDWWNANNFNEAMRQADASLQLNYDQLAEQQRQYNQNMAYNYVMAMIQAGKRPSAELLAAAGLSQADLDTWVPEVDETGGWNPGTTSTSTSSGSNKKKTTGPIKGAVTDIITTSSGEKPSTQDRISKATSTDTTPTNSSGWIGNLYKKLNGQK